MAVAINRNTAIVGDHVGSFEFQSFRFSAAYIFERNQGIWGAPQRLRLVSSIPGCNFGDSVAISSDDTVVVGAPHHSRANFFGRVWQGSVYVFVRSGGIVGEATRVEN
jgi:hypothetical protein